MTFLKKGRNEETILSSMHMISIIIINASIISTEIMTGLLPLCNNVITSIVAQLVI